MSSTKVWQTNFQQAWFGYPWKAVSSDVICFSSGKSLLLGHQMMCCPVRVWCFLWVCHVNPSVPWSLVAHWLGSITWWGLSIEVEESSSGGVFSNRWNLQVTKCVWWLRSSLLESALWKDCSTKTLLFLIEAIWPLHYWTISSFISCGSEEPSALRVLWLSKGESLWVPKGVDVRFRRTNGNAFGQGIWRASTNFVNWVLIMPLVCSTKREHWGW